MKTFIILFIGLFFGGWFLLSIVGAIFFGTFWGAYALVVAILAGIFTAIISHFENAAKWEKEVRNFMETGKSREFRKRRSRSRRKL